MAAARRRWLMQWVGGDLKLGVAAGDLRCTDGSKVRQRDATARGAGQTCQLHTWARLFATPHGASSAPELGPDTTFAATQCILEHRALDKEQQRAGANGGVM